MLIRTANHHDLDDLMALCDALDAPEQSSRPPRTQLEAALSLILADEHRFLLVAEMDDHLVGMCDLRLALSLTHGLSVQALVDNVVVLPSHQGQGIGTRLMQEAEQLAKLHGAYKIDLVSYAHRASAHGMYEKLGYDSAVRGFRRLLP